MGKYQHPTVARSTLLKSLMTSAALLLAADPVYAGSVADTIRAALATNPELGVVKNDRRAVDQELRQARALYLPSIDLRAAVGPEVTNSPSTRLRGPGSTDTAEQFTRQSQLRLSQLLFDGFETINEIRRQESRVDSAAFRVQEAAEFIAVDAVEAHLEVLRNRDIIRLNEENVAAHNRILGQVRDLERSGGTGIADVRQAEARFANAQANLAESVGSYNDALALYQRVVGDVPVDLEEPTAPVAALPANRDAAADIASVRSPTVLIAASDVDVAAAELKGSRSGFYPRFDLELTGNADRNIDGVDGEDASASALVVMRYNLYRGGADIAREREAFHRLNEARSQLSQARREAEEQARVSLNAYETARARTSLLRDEAEAQRRTRDAYASQFEIGQRDLLDLLDAENQLFLARVQLATAGYTEEFAVYRALGVIGVLLDTLEFASPRDTINIYRAPDEVQSPERILEKSQQLYDPKAEPRPLRGEDAGEPPVLAPDAADVINRPAQPVPEAPTVLTPQSSIEPAAAPPAQAAAEPESERGSGLAGFWKSITGGGSKAADASPRSQQVVTRKAAASPSHPPTGGASYESFGDFWNAVRGKGRNEGSAAVVAGNTGSGAPAAEATTPSASSASSTGAPEYESFAGFWKSMTQGSADEQEVASRTSGSESAR